MNALSARLAWAALVLVLGCRSTSTPGGPTAECPVCLHEGDLACVSVLIDPDTPRCECGGQAYYFCSEECRADFQARPERYRVSGRDR